VAAVDLCTLADVRLQAKHRVAYTSDDSLISPLITAASRQIMRETEREFSPATAAATRRRRVHPDRISGGAYLVELAPYDLRSVTAVTLHPEAASPVTVAAADRLLMPVEATDGVYTQLLLDAALSLNSDTLTSFGFALVDIAGAWGFAAVNEDVKQAAIVTVLSWLQRDTAAFGLQELGDEPRAVQPDLPANFSLPPAARRLLAPWRRAPKLG
jgi:hypothetical protein